MKVTFYLLAFSLIACTNNSTVNDPEAKREEFKKDLDLLEIKGLKSGLVTDSVFMGYYFGMTPKEYFKHTYDLNKIGKLKTENNDDYYLEIDTKLGTYKGYVYGDWYHDSLSSIALVFKDERYPLNVFTEVGKLYESKYGKFDLINQPVKELSVYQKYWVRDNLKLKMQSGINDATIEYIDLRKEKRKTAADSLEKSNKQTELKKGI